MWPLRERCMQERGHLKNSDSHRESWNLFLVLKVLCIDKQIYSVYPELLGFSKNLILFGPSLFLLNLPLFLSFLCSENHHHYKNILSVISVFQEKWLFVCPHTSHHIQWLWRWRKGFQGGCKYNLGSSVCLLKVTYVFFSMDTRNQWNKQRRIL